MARHGGQPRRVLVVGPPGVGKSRVAERLASTYGLAHTQLDSLKLRPVRQVASAEQFRVAIEHLLEGDSWLLDGNWDDDEEARRVWADADLVIWLDYPRPVVMWQVARRSLRRLLRQEDYFGWTERLRDWLSPTHPLRWSWKMVHTYSERYSLMTSRLAPRQYVRLRSRAEVPRYLEQLR